MIDLHCHILPGVDDGSRSLEESVAMAREAVAGGVSVVVATPHVRADFPTTADAIEEGVHRVRAELRREDVALQVLPGAEVALERLDALSHRELARLGLGGNPRFLLVETPTWGWPLDLGERLFFLRSRGVTPVVAHPERSADVQKHPELLHALVDAGALVQVTASSVVGRAGRPAYECARALIGSGYAHAVASDAHAPGRTRSGLSDAVVALGDPDVARWLTNDVPRAILADEALPPAPSPRLKGWARLLGRLRP